MTPPTNMTAIAAIDHANQRPTRPLVRRGATRRGPEREDPARRLGIEIVYSI
jgi:hypothetical protein